MLTATELQAIIREQFGLESWPTFEGESVPGLHKMLDNQGIPWSAYDQHEIKPGRTGIQHRVQDSLYAALGQMDTKERRFASFLAGVRTKIRLCCNINNRDNVEVAGIERYVVEVMQECWNKRVPTLPDIEGTLRHFDLPKREKINELAKTDLKAIIREQFAQETFPIFKGKALQGLGKLLEELRIAHRPSDKADAWRINTAVADSLNAAIEHMEYMDERSLVLFLDCARTKIWDSCNFNNRVKGVEQFVINVIKECVKPIVKLPTSSAESVARLQSAPTPAASVGALSCHEEEVKLHAEFPKKDLSVENQLLRQQMEAMRVEMEAIRKERDVLRQTLEAMHLPPPAYEDDRPAVFLPSEHAKVPEVENTRDLDNMPKRVSTSKWG